MPKTLRGWRALAEYYGKSMSTVREWDCPFELDGTTHIFDTDKVDEWLRNRSDHITDDELIEAADDDQKAALLKARIDKVQLEADRLRREKNIEDGLYGSIEEFEKSTIKLLVEMKSLMTELFTELLESSDLSASDKEQLQARLIDGFNEIAGINDG